jgi:hypothetical protein
VTQHATLSPERWSAFSLDQQILMIANEMNRAGKLTRPGDGDRRRSAYERVLNLTDLTIRVRTKRTFRREMLRWRDLVAEMYVAETTNPEAHASAFRALLRFTPEASKQLAALS